MIAFFNIKIIIMRKLQIIGLILAMAFAFSACEKVTDVEVIVIKDCTGSYLRYENKDFHICNYETVKNIENETVIKASFKKVKKCSSDTLAVCMMYHKNEGWIEVLKIKKL